MQNEFIDENIAKYQRDLSHLCYSLCRNVSDAENLFQETWLMAIKNQSKYCTEKPFNKWLFAICINIYRDQCRKRKRENVIEFRSNEDKDKYLQSIPDENIDYNEMGDLYYAIEALPVNYRIVISLKYFKDYTEKEISSIIGIPLGTVKSRLHKAKKLLKGNLSYED